MSSRIIRSDERLKKLKVSTLDRGAADGISVDQLQLLEKQAFEQGYREGERIGRKLGDDMMETAAKRYDRAIAELAEAYIAVVNAVETSTVELALEIARKVIQREISTDPDLVSALATVALRRVQSHPSITIRVSRYDFPRVSEAIAGINDSVAVVEDPSLERGDFMIDSSQTRLDGRIRSQVESLGRAMLEQ